MYYTDYGLRLKSGRKVILSKPWWSLFWIDSIHRQVGITDYDNIVKRKINDKEFSGVHICDSSKTKLVGSIEDSVEFIPIEQIESIFKIDVNNSHKQSAVESVWYSWNLAAEASEAVGGKEMELPISFIAATLRNAIDEDKEST